jgi:hypothetical protein
VSFRMDMRVEKVLEDGAYDAKLVNVEPKETKHGDRLMWTFEVAGENTEVVGFTKASAPRQRLRPTSGPRPSRAR